MVDRYEGAGGGTAGEVRIEVDGFEIVDSLRAEIERLQDAKRRALDIADERGKEVVALRAALKPLAAISLWRDKYPDGPDTLEDDRLHKWVKVQDVRAARDALEQSVATQNADPAIRTCNLTAEETSKDVVIVDPSGDHKRGVP